jgi:hypothetical protein
VYLAVKTGRKPDLYFRSRFRPAYALLLLAELGLIDAEPVESGYISRLSERARVVADLFARLYAAQRGAASTRTGTVSLASVRRAPCQSGWCRSGAGAATAWRGRRSASF